MRDLFAAEVDLARGGARHAADHIAHRALARTVGTDDDAKLIVPYAKVVNVQCFEPVENRRHVLKEQQIASRPELAVSRGRWLW